MALLEGTDIPIIRSGDGAPGPSRPKTDAAGLVVDYDATAYDPDPSHLKRVVGLNIYEFDSIDWDCRAAG